MSILQTTELKKYYGAKPNITRALDGVTLSIEKGEFVAIVGTSGSGKSTLLNMIGGLDVPTSGKVIVDGRELSTLKDEQLTIFRRRKIGFIFQNYNLVPVLNVYENIVLPVELDGNKVDKKFMKEVVQMLGLEDKLDFYVDGLSRGMKQRLCLARALIHDPQILILDEPTSGLDPRTRVEFKEILEDLKFAGKTILISSHVLSELSEMCTDIGIIDQGRMILEGNIQDILSRVNASNPLVISVYSNMEKALSILKSHPCVRTISMREKDICVRFTGDAQDEAILLQQLIDSDVLVNGFTREKGSLETVFMQLTDHEEERVVTSYEAESGL